MTDPFYVTRGEFRHNLGRLRTNVQSLENHYVASAVSEEQRSKNALFDKSLVPETVSLIEELGHQLADLNDTYTIQLGKAKQLGFTSQEMANRANIVERHQKDFGELKASFALQLHGDRAANPDTIINSIYEKRETSQRRYQVDNPFNTFRKDSIPLMTEPNRTSMHEMKQQKNFADDDADEDLVEIYQRKALDSEKNTARVQNRKEAGGIGSFFQRHFPLSNKRNRIIFFSIPVAVTLIIIIVVLSVTLTR